MMRQKLVSVVIGTYNRKTLLRKTIESVRAEFGKLSQSCEMIVVDGGSDDGTLKWLCRQRDVISVVQHNRGKWMGKDLERRSWGYFMNLGFKIAQGKYVCMLSDDCLVIPGAITEGVKCFEEMLSEGKSVGAVAFYWRNWPTEQAYRVGLTVGKNVFVNHGLYLNSALSKIGYADEENFHFYHADGDLCLRMLDAGYSCEVSQKSFIEHYADANSFVRKSNLEKQKRDWDFYLSRWRHLLNRTNGYEGGWLTVEFRDPYRTASALIGYYRFDQFKKFVNRLIVRLFR